MTSQAQAPIKLNRALVRTQSQRFLVVGLSVVIQVSRRYVNESLEQLHQV